MFFPTQGWQWSVFNVEANTFTGRLVDIVAFELH
jgi:hypothetical protein